MTLKALGKAARFINGAAFKPIDWGNEGLPIIRIQNLTGTGERFNYTTRKVKPELVVDLGDLLISWSATLDVYRWTGPRGALNQHIFKVLPEPGINSDYLFFALKNALAELSTKTHGSTMKHVVRSDFESTLIRVPSLSEQRHIVDLLSRAGSIVRLRREAEKKAAELIPALFLDMCGDPAVNKRSWPVQQLRDVSQVVSGVAKGRKFNGKDTVMAPYLRVANVQGGYLDLKEIKTIEALPSEVEQLALKHGDVLLTEGGDYDKLGRGAMWTHDLPRCIHQNHIFRVRVDRKWLFPEYFEAYLQTQLARNYFLKSAKRTTNLASINMTQLRALPVMLPPLSVQQSFVARVAATDSINAKQAEAARRSDELFKSLLHRVFQSRLRR